MVIYGSFAAWTFAWIWNHPNGKSLNIKIFVKCIWWKKVKVKALEKSGTASKSVFLCAYLQAGVQSAVCVFPVEAVNPDPARPPSFSPEPTKTWRQLPCDFIHSLATVQEASLGCGSSGFQWISQVVRLLFTAVLSPTAGSASPHSLAWSPRGPCRMFCHLKTREWKVVYDLCRFCSLQRLVKDP